MNTRFLPLKLIVAWTSWLKNHQSFRMQEHQLKSEGGIETPVFVVACTFNFWGKIFFVDSAGKLFMWNIAYRPRNAPQYMPFPVTHTQNHASILDWLEYHTKSLINKKYTIEPITDPHQDLPPGVQAISLFPNSGPLTSRAVTRGVEVKAQACPLLEAMWQLGKCRKH